jgi:hypothetical protein
MKAQEREDLLHVLEARFEKNMHRHRGVAWSDVRAKLEGNPPALRSLYEMESTGGEPDVVGHDKETNHYTFCDCSAESQQGEGVFATTVKRLSPGRNTNRRTAQLKWLRRWASIF